mgnify:FL=1
MQTGDSAAPASARELPSGPRPVIGGRSVVDRPQPRLDRLSHNTIRGVAGGSIYNVELLVIENLL